MKAAHIIHAHDPGLYKVLDHYKTKYIKDFVGLFKCNKLDCLSDEAFLVWVGFVAGKIVATTEEYLNA